MQVIERYSEDEVKAMLTAAIGQATRRAVRKVTFVARQFEHEDGSMRQTLDVDVEMEPPTRAAQP